MEKRVGDWIQTFSGKPFWPLDPRPSEVEIEDIARSLSMRCRYAGHVTEFYSVAEHSVHISQNVPQEFALWGLLHDAAEAYSADVPRPLKKNLPDWPAMEGRIMAAVCDRFGMERAEPPCVKKADFRICADEKAQILRPSALEWDETPEPLGIHLPCWCPAQAERMFLSRFDQITMGKIWVQKI